MSHAVEVPDDLYRKIADYATIAKQEPDMLILEWVKAATEHLTAIPVTPPANVTFDDPAQRGSTDPMTLLAGIIDSHDPGWANDHDTYFGSDDGVSGSDA